MEKFECTDKNGDKRIIRVINGKDFKNKSMAVHDAYQDMKNKKITTKEFEIIYDRG
jgi:hypothetical protein